VITISGERLIVDNEHAEFSQIILDGRSADIYEGVDPSSLNMIVIYDDMTGLFITLDSEIEIAELILIAESIG